MHLAFAFLLVHHCRVVMDWGPNSKTLRYPGSEGVDLII